MSNESNWGETLASAAAVGMGLLGAVSVVLACESVSEEKAKLEEIDLIEREARELRLEHRRASRLAGPRYFGHHVPSELSPSGQAVAELLSLHDSRDRFKMYKAMAADGIVFSNVQKLKLRKSFSNSGYRSGYGQFIT